MPISPDHPAVILLVEDNPGDIRLAREVFKEIHTPNTLYVVENGEFALHFLRHTEGFEHAPRPDLILLDLNLPCRDGRQLLAEIKSDKDLGIIPVIVLTTSIAEEDIVQAYNLHANAYLTKSTNLDRFNETIHSLEQFWFHTATLPGFR